MLQTKIKKPREFGNCSRECSKMDISCPFPDRHERFEGLLNLALLAIFHLAVLFVHGSYVRCGNMIVMPETAAEIFGDMHQFMDDRLFFFFFIELVESFRQELQHIKSLYPHGDLKNLAHSVTPGNDSSCRGPVTPDAYDLVQIDMREVQRPNDILETILDIVCQFVSDIGFFSLRHRVSGLSDPYFDSLPPSCQSMDDEPNRYRTHS